MTARTPNDVLKAKVGDLMFENANLLSANDVLRDKLIEVGRMLPPGKLEELKLKIVDEGEPLTPPETRDPPVDEEARDALFSSRHPAAKA